MLQPLLKTLWQLFKTCTVELLHGPAIPYSKAFKAGSLGYLNVSVIGAEKWMPPKNPLVVSGKTNYHT